MIIVIITRRREEAEVQSLVEGLFNEPPIIQQELINQEEIVHLPTIIQQESVPEPNPMTQVGIVHEPIGQFRQGVGIILPFTPRTRAYHLFLGKTVPSERYEFY